MNTPVPVLQNEDELERVYQVFLDRKPTKTLEIGSMYGGTLYHWLNGTKPGGLVVSVDLMIPQSDPRYQQVAESRQLWQGWAEVARVELSQNDGDSHDPLLINLAEHYAPYDVIFIDGDHSLRGVTADFENYWPMVKPGGLMIFHDISCPDVNEYQIGSGTFWRELVSKGVYVTSSIENTPAAWGFGLIFKPEPISEKFGADVKAVERRTKKGKSK